MDIVKTAQQFIQEYFVLLRQWPFQTRSIIRRWRISSIAQKFKDL